MCSSLVSLLRFAPLTDTAAKCLFYDTFKFLRMQSFLSYNFLIFFFKSDLPTILSLFRRFLFMIY